MNIMEKLRAERMEAALIEIREELSRPENAEPIPATLAEHCAQIATMALERVS